MRDDEFERMKAEEKEHLRQMKALKQKYREAQQKGRIRQALENMDPRKLFDRHDALLEDLALDTLREEARMDMALDTEQTREAAEAEAQRARYEEDQRKAQAADLVRRFKAELDTPAAAPATTPSPTPSSPKPNAADPAAPPLPEKTIGRIKQKPPNVYDLKRRDETD